MTFTQPLPFLRIFMNAVVFLLLGCHPEKQEETKNDTLFIQTCKSFGETCQINSKVVPYSSLKVSSELEKSKLKEALQKMVDEYLGTRFNAIGAFEDFDHAHVLVDDRSRDRSLVSEPRTPFAIIFQTQSGLIKGTIKKSQAYPVKHREDGTVPDVYQRPNVLYNLDKRKKTFIFFLSDGSLHLGADYAYDDFSPEVFERKRGYGLAFADRVVKEYKEHRISQNHLDFEKLKANAYHGNSVYFYYFDCETVPSDSIKDSNLLILSKNRFDKICLALFDLPQ